MDITEAILKVANDYGRLHGYILTEGEKGIDAAKSKKRKNNVFIPLRN